MAEPQGAMEPPLGVTPNFDNPKDELHTITIVTQVLCMVFVTAFFFLRVWIRLNVLHIFTSEDCSYCPKTQFSFPPWIYRALLTVL